MKLKCDMWKRCFMRFNILCKKFKLKYFERFTHSYYFTEILRDEGFDIGEHTIFYDPKSQTLDRERPWMLKIGDYCKITRGCSILTHDYSRSVIRMYCGDVIGEAGETIIGNNVFIGINSVILMGTQIGDNVIIGSGSVVSGKIPSNVVVAGNPAKIIRTLDDHIEKRRSRTLKEGVLYFNKFFDKYKRQPSIREMGPFYPLFLERSYEALISNCINIAPNGDNSDDIIKHFLNSKPYFSSFEEFKEYALNNK